MLKPTQNYVFIKLHDVSSDSGIQLPAGVQRKPYGEVLEVGPDCQDNYDEKVGFFKRLQPGMFIHFMTSALIGFDETEKTCFIAEPSILAIYNERP